MSLRKIIHIDMDAFFASVEQRDNAALRGQPIAVGYDGPRGVVSTASYEARRYGVHSAMSMARAKRLCPELIIVPGRYHVYKEVSAAIHRIMSDYTDLIEPLSLDEAFLDVTTNKIGADMAVAIARQIKQRIRQELHLTASAGIFYNKFLAKIASDYRKPDGICTIHPDRALDFIGQLRIEQFWGVGEKTAQRMHRIGIFTGADLRQCSRQHLIEHFGKMGSVFYDFARGIDHRPVITDYERKSVGCEHTFLEDIYRPAAVTIELYHTVLELVGRIERADFDGQTLTLKVKFADFRQITRSQSHQKPLRRKDDILPMAKALLRQVDISEAHPIRLLGLSVSHPPAAESFSSAQPVELELEFEDWPE